MSRTKKILKNAKVSTFFFVITTFVGFYSRSIFLEHLGDEFIGLTATLLSFLNFLNLVELGIGTAMGFSMYNSIFNKNYDKINDLFALIGYLYNKLGKIILISGIILSLFFPLIFSKTPIDILLIYYVFYIYLLGSLLYYFYNFHLMLLQADQKGYIPTAYKQSLHIIKIIVQIVVLYFTNSPAIFITIELISLLVFNVLLKSRIKKEYPWLTYAYAKDKSILAQNKDLILKIKQVFVHRISSFILKSTDNVVIYTFASLQSVTYVNNYYIIIGSGTTLLTNFLSGTTAAVGNLVAEKDKLRIKKVFWELMSLNHFMGGLLVLSLYFGINPVISLWLGEKYVMSNEIVMLLLANLYIMKMRVPMDEFINAYGLFNDIWAPITEAILNLTISIVLAYFWGVSGVLLGTFISVTLLALIWKPYFLYKNGFKEKISIYWKGFFALLFSFSSSAIICFFIVTKYLSINQDNWGVLILSLLKIGILILVIYTSIMYLFNSGFRVFISRAISFVKNKIRKP